MTESSEYAQALAQSIGAQQAFKVAIVAAVHIQPSKQWIDALNYASKTATIIIVDDSDGKVVLPENWDVFGYGRQLEVMGDEMYEHFKMFHKSSACKTFGLWNAYQRGFDPIIVIDSDCVIPPDFIARHLEALLAYGDGWDNPLKGTGFYSRGFPYYERSKPVWAHMGLWENELDLYGTDRVGLSYIPKMPPPKGITSNGAMFPLSGMNVSFRNDAAPYMMFLPNFNNGDERFTRHDDIWGGYIFQKIARAKGFTLSYGAPNVFHDTVVVPEEDAKDEESMIKHERQFYTEIGRALQTVTWMDPNQITPTKVYDAIAEWLEHVKGHPFGGLIPAFDFAGATFDENHE